MSRPKGPITNPSKIIRELMEIMDATGLSQAEVADRAGVSQSTISMMRSNQRAYSTVLIAEWVGQALGYHLEWKPNDQQVAQQYTQATNPYRARASYHKRVDRNEPVPHDKRLRRDGEDD